MGLIFHFVCILTKYAIIGHWKFLGARCWQCCGYSDFSLFYPSLFVFLFYFVSPYIREGRGKEKRSIENFFFLLSTYLRRETEINPRDRFHHIVHSSVFAPESNEHFTQGLSIRSYTEETSH